MQKFTKVFIFLVIMLFPLLGCSGEAEEDPTIPVLERDIVGIWRPIDNINGLIWQFLEDGTFIDTEGVRYGYYIQEVDGITYLGFDREGLNITLIEEDEAELDRVVGQSDYILIYEANMTSKNTLVLDPASTLYGSDSYFNFNFETLILVRQ